MSFDYEPDEPIELRAQKCEARLTSIDRQLRNPAVMAAHKGLNKDELREWIASAEIARRATLEELIELRYLLHVEARDLKSENITLRKKVESLEGKLKNALAQVQSANKKIIEYKRNNKYLIARIKPESTLRYSDEELEEISKTSEVVASLYTKLQNQKKHIAELTSKLEKRSCPQDPTSESHCPTEE